MTEHIKRLIEKAATIQMSPDDREAQRRSFAFGNANIENEPMKELLEAYLARQLTGAFDAANREPIIAPEQDRRFHCARSLSPTTARQPRRSSVARCRRHAGAAA